MLLLLPALMIHFGVIGTDHPDHYDLRGFVPQLFLLQSFPILHNVPFNSPSWSISAEMICYCFLPVLLWMHRRWSPTLPLVISMAVAALIAFAGDSWLTWTYQWSFLRAFPSFAFGLFLGHHREKLSRIPCAKTLMIALGVILLAMGLNGAPYLACFACLYVFMLAACACDAQSISTRLTKLAPLSALTYSIYMLHDMVEHFGMGKLAKSTAKISPILANSIVLCGFIALFIIAYLSFTYFENPARNYLSGKRKPLSTTYSLPKGTPIAPELQP
jgi:peptidoglycan/LPS O-acetylase OafA/YrhL